MPRWFPGTDGYKVPAPEIAAAALLALIGCAISMIVVPNARGLFGCALIILAIAVAVVDARRFIIPDGLSLSLLAFAFGQAWLFPEDGVTEAIALAALRASVLGLAFMAFRQVYSKMRKRSGIGLGDVKLAGVAGAWLDWAAIAVAIEVAALVALLVVLVRYIRGEQLTGTTAIPFGLFLAPSIWVGWIFEAIFLRIS
jgi:leader peptidase (prepilin peptidase)/N-methyltransferase